MSRKEMKRLSDMCLSCVTKPCQLGCPLNNDITGFIKCLKDRRYQDAFDVLSKTTVLMPICGKICPHFSQCEGACIRGVSHRVVEIGKLEAFVGDLALENGYKFSSKKTTKYSVAVIGGGPAGLSCAAFLRRGGIGVTIYEKKSSLGGILTHGIPSFRLPGNVVKKTIDNIIDLGIKVEYNRELGVNLTLSELKKKYDAIFIGVGANLSNNMNIDGEDLCGVYGGNELLESGSFPGLEGKTVVVSGGGNVSMDVSRTLKRSGAKKVIVVYRRSEAEMPADKKEIRDAKKDKVEFLFQTNIKKILGDRCVSSVNVVKTRLEVQEGSSRKVPIDIEDSNYNIPCDYVVMAVGSHASDEVLELGLDMKNDKIKIDLNGKTSSNKIFAGGDVAGVRQTVAWASRSGRNAAYSIIKYLNSKEKK